MKKSVSATPQAGSGAKRRRRFAPILLAAFLSTAAAGAQTPAREAAIDGLHLYIEEAVWLEDQMEHDPKGYAMPQAMMPDLPAHGAWRLNVALSLRNSGKAQKRYDPADFTLVAGQGAALAPLDGHGGAVALGPGQRLNASFNFDFEGSGEEGEFYLRWRQGEEIVMLPLPQPQGARQTHRGGRPGNSKNGGGPAPPHDDHHRHDAGSAGKAGFYAAAGIAPKAAGDERRND